MPRKTPGPPCLLCERPATAHKLCNMHGERLRVTGDPTKTLRPDDWGKRNKHPLNHTWRNTVRNGRSREVVWDDFWKFVEDVGGDKPVGLFLTRIDDSKPYGPENFIWKKRRVLETRARDDHGRYQREWRAENRIKAKHYDLKRTYGISLADYDAMLESQNGCCAVCHGQCTHRKYLSVDHCHRTGKIRGLLCSNCNTAVGYLKDDKERAMRLAIYLEDRG